MKRRKVRCLDASVRKLIAYLLFKSIKTRDDLLIHVLRVKLYLARALIIHHLACRLIDAVFAVSDVLFKALKRTAYKRHDIFPIIGLAAVGNIRRVHQSAQIELEIIYIAAAVPVAIRGYRGVFRSEHRAGAKIIYPEALPCGELDGHRAANGLIPLLLTQHGKRLRLSHAADIRAADIDVWQVCLARAYRVRPDEHSRRRKRKNGKNDYHGN